MKDDVRHERIWKIICPVIRWTFEKLFSYSHDTHKLQYPSLVVINHVTNYDPLLVAISFPQSMMYFVASEHLFRLGWVSKLITWLVDPIARRKGSKGFDAAMTCLRRIRAGHSVALFAEGETTWDGVTQDIYSATTMLAKASGGALVTYRLEGGYLTSPRWGRGIRRGKMHGHVVNVYPPEMLKGMKDPEIRALIDRDLYEDTWQRQKEAPVAHRSKHAAERLEVALCVCPKCKQVGKMHSSGDRLTCECGMEVRYTETGFFEPAEPFKTVREWNLWQKEQLENRLFEHGEKLFSDPDMTLYEILEGHEVKELETGELSIDEDALYVGQRCFAHGDISDLALVTTRKLLFTSGDHYYELRASEPRCLRKYLIVWQTARKEKA